MYLYETHLHTAPVSKCARRSVRENVEFYKQQGYDGIFITNHFLDGYINIDPSLPYEERINFYFSDYEEALKIGKEVGIKVFCGVELSYGGTDFLIYGLDKAWYLAHPEIEGMKKSDELALMKESGALVIQAHPFRDASYIDHIRLYPKYVHGTEVYNANRSDFENTLAEQFAENYGLIPFGGTDNHMGKDQKKFGGMESELPIQSEEHFVKSVMAGLLRPFKREINE